LCRHPDYDKQQQLQQQECGAEGAAAGWRDKTKTYAAYVTADLAFRQSSPPAASAAAAASVQLAGDTTTFYTLDDEATARLDAVHQQAVDQHDVQTLSSNRPRRTASKT